MSTLALAADERVADVEVTEDELRVRLMDGRTISVPLVWYPRLLNASNEQRKNWQIIGGGYGLHWEDVDEDLSTEGLLRGAPAPRRSLAKVEPSSIIKVRVVDGKESEQKTEVAGTIEYDGDKGFLDYLTEGEETTVEFNAILSTIDNETRNIGVKFNQQTANIERLTKQSGGAKARGYQKIMLVAASDMNTFSQRIEDILPKFEKCIRNLEEIYFHLVSFADPESSNDNEQISNLRNSITKLLGECRPVQESVIGFRDSTLSIANQKVTKELTKAAIRQSQVLNGVIFNIEHVETFALKVIHLIDIWKRSP